MKENFDLCHPWVLAHEGGYVNHPKDPGGATNQGITTATYRAYLKRKGLPMTDVRNLTPEQRDEIYRTQYWDKVMGDDLPDGIDYAIYDFAVNSGPGRAVKFIQRIVGVKEDGVMGLQTLAAIRGVNDRRDLIIRLCEERFRWLKRLKTWGTFGKGWTRRVMGEELGAQNTDRGVIDRAVLMLYDDIGKVVVKPIPGSGARTDDVTERVNVPAAAKDNADALTAGGVLTGLLGGATQTDGAVQIMLAGAALLVVGFLVWRSWKAQA